MTAHDAIRRDRAMAYKSATFTSLTEELVALEAVIGGLQSTDDPELVPLYNELLDRWNMLCGSKDEH